jgi:plasmid maintenance system antidote protein VapI
LAKETSVPPRRINEIVRGQRAISADTALRLARYFGTSERFWSNLQVRYDLEKKIGWADDWSVKCRYTAEANVDAQHLPEWIWCYQPPT